jgi:chorismate synthase
MNQFGQIFRIQIFGESHGHSIGVVIDGCPAGIPISAADFSADIERRKGGKAGSTTRNEDDVPKIISGVYKDKTAGSPITVLFDNKNINSDDYQNIINHPRPGHADYTANKKYFGFNDPGGGGHFSGRLTLPIVAAGVLAKKIIAPVSVNAILKEAGGNQNIEEAVKQAIASNDSIGGIIECVVGNVPVGLGEPFFDSVESTIAHLAFSIPAVKGIEFGLGFQSAKIFGSKMNDLFVDENGKTSTNHSGGVLGGISNGNNIVFRIAVKPTSSITKPQETYNFKDKQIKPLTIKGRHDTCIALRMPVIIESIATIALADFLLLKKTYSPDLRS